MATRVPYWQRRIGRRGVLVAGGAAAFLAACGGSGGDKAKTDTEAVKTLATAGPSTDDESPQAVVGGTWRYRTSTDYPTLDPFKTASFASQYHGAYVYSRLSRFKTGAGIDPGLFEIADDAATGFETADGLTYVYKLRPDNKFHNIAPVSGRALDAGDVKFSHERFISVSPNQNALKSLIDKVETPDNQTVVFKLKLRYAPFPTQIASAADALWLFPKEAENYDPAKVSIGTGPFLLDKDVPSVGTTYNRNPTWWWKGRPFVNGTQRIIIPEQAQYLAQFVAKKIDEYVPTNIEVLEVRKQVPDALFTKVNIATTYNFIFFSGQEPDSPFKDVRVRRAVSLALDRQGLLDNFSNREALEKAGIPIETAWANVPIAPAYKKWWINPQDAGFKEGEWYRYNLAEAKKLLAAAGFANGFKTEYHFTPTRYGQTFDSSAEAVVEMMKQLGLDLDVKVDDYNKVYFPEVFTKGNFKGMVYGLESDFPDVDGRIYNMFHPEGIRNHSKINMPGGTLFQDGGKLTAMVEAQRTEVDEAKRKQVIGDIQRYASDQMIYVPGVIGGYSTFALGWPWVRNTRAYRSVTYAAPMEAWAHYWLDEEKRKQLGG